MLFARAILHIMEWTPLVISLHYPNVMQMQMQCLGAMS